jgi:hypothetical protein
MDIDVPELFRFAHRLVRRGLLAPASSVAHTASAALAAVLLPAEVAMRVQAQLVDDAAQSTTDD